MAKTTKHIRLHAGDRTEAVTFQWDASAGATGYLFYYGTQTGVYSGSFAVSGTTYSLSPTPGNHFYAVRAYNANNTSGYSNEVGGMF